MTVHKCKLPKMWRKVATNLTLTATCSTCGRTFILDKKYNQWNALAVSCYAVSYAGELKNVKEM